MRGLCCLMGLSPYGTQFKDCTSLQKEISYSKLFLFMAQCAECTGLFLLAIKC